MFGANDTPFEYHPGSEPYTISQGDPPKNARNALQMDKVDKHHVKMT
jgi:hypothetical protein